MKTEDNDTAWDKEDSLWQLLGEAKTPGVSPYLSRNVLRAIRESDAGIQDRRGFLAWLLRGGRMTLAGGVAAVLLAGVGGIVFEQHHAAVVADDQRHGKILLAQQVAKNPDSEVIRNLDELLASDDSSIWLDNSP